MRLVFLIVILLLNLPSIAQNKGTTIQEDIDILKYKIEDFQIIPSKKLIRAKTHIKVVSRNDLQELKFRLHDSFYIVSVEINDTLVKSKFTDKNILSVYPNKKISRSKTFDVSILYYGTKNSKELWASTIKNNNFVFNDSPLMLLFPGSLSRKDRAEFDINIVVPEDYKVASVSTANRLKSNRHYNIKSSNIRERNFHLSLFNQFSSFKILLHTDYGFSSTRLFQFTPIDSTIVFRDLLAGIPKQLDFMYSVLGYYPYKSFNVVITKVDSVHRTLFKRRTIYTPYIFTLDSTEIEKNLVAAISKQWFGNKIIPKRESDLWITEGLSRYMEWLWAEEKYGRKVFSEMIDAKFIETEKRMGLKDWQIINHHPLYSFDLSNCVYEFGHLSKEKMVSGDELKFLCEIISLDINNASDKVKNSFREEFGHNIEQIMKNSYSYYDLLKWAKDQEKGSFAISADGFYTLISMQNKKFQPFELYLSDPNAADYKGEKLNHFRNRAALFIHYIRLHIGDEEFFDKLKDQISEQSGKLSTEIILNIFNTDAEIVLPEETVDLWLNSTDKLPLLPQSQE